MKGKEEATRAKAEYRNEYCHREPLSDYYSMLGLSNLRIMQESGQKFELREGESLDDYCIHVGLREELPEDIGLPSEYNGFRVFYDVVGEIVPEGGRVLQSYETPVPDNEARKWFEDKTKR